MAIPLLAVRGDAVQPYVRVLSAVTLLDAAAVVLRTAGRMAEATPIRVLHVPPDPAGRDSTAADRTVPDAAVVQALRALIDRAGLGEDEVEASVRPGAIDALLPQAVADADADLVVIGTTTHTKSAVARWLVGSHAERALLQVGCDVLVVPLGVAERR
jgi:nucleotide-binding universal stress UspA family protein